jgi:endonuclease/exonuclease/phosphatase family metal-dependent hydrolase
MTKLTVVSFNTHAGLHAPAGLHGCPPYDLEQVLRDFEADVIVLQEVWQPDDDVSPVEKAAAARGDELHTVSLGRAVRTDRGPRLRLPGAGNGTVSVAVLTRHPVVSSAELPVGRVLGDPALDRRALHLGLDVDGIVVDVVAVHLTSRLPHGPPIQMRRLRTQLPDGARPAIVAGDFNLWGPGVSACLPGWRRPVRGRSWPSHRPHSQIDHVLLGSGIEMLDAAVLDDVGSDHRPIRVILDLR